MCLSKNRETAAPEMYYRPFFAFAIFFLLVTGAGWGVYFLWEIARTGRVIATGLPLINAHGHSLIFGMAGMFILGFAAQAFPRLLGKPLAAPMLLKPVLAAYAGGVALTILAQVGALGQAGAQVALAAGVLESAAVVTFASQIVLIHRRGAMPVSGFWFAIYAALAFMAVCPIADALLTHSQLRSESRGELIYVTSIFQPAVRYLEYHGMILLMIAGVAARMLPSFYPIPVPTDRKMRVITALFVLGALLEATTFVAFRLSEDARWGSLMGLGWLMLAGGTLWLIWPWKPWRTWPDRANGRIERTAKFIRTSLIWLLVAWTMALLLPFWGMMTGTAFSHAFHGAARQAFVVGFVLQMIIGFSSRVVPTLCGILPTELPSLRGVWWMLNLGLALHITGMVGIDLTASARWALPPAGVLQWVALAWWAGHLVHCMVTGSRRAAEASRPNPHRVGLPVLQNH
jgi:hypothetical protein